jgi:uncharacterized membrane protein YeiB
MQSFTPVQIKDREILMNMLRGFAILGIFIANLGSGFGTVPLKKNSNQY